MYHCQFFRSSFPPTLLRAVSPSTMLSTSLTVPSMGMFSIHTACVFNSGLLESFHSLPPLPFPLSPSLQGQDQVVHLTQQHDTLCHCVGLPYQPGAALWPGWEGETWILLPPLQPGTVPKVRECAISSNIVAFILPPPPLFSSFHPHLLLLLSLLLSFLLLLLLLSPSSPLLL